MNGKAIRRICNLVPSKGTERDWRFEHAIEAEAVGAVAALPSSYDLRVPWWAIGDQQATGSCVGWGSTDGVMRYHLVKAGKLGQNELLSPRYTWMASKESDEFVARPESFIEEAGTSLKAAMEICRNYGVVTNELLPFHINTLMYTDGEEKFYATAATRRLSAYFNLGKDLNRWRVWLASHGPILVGVNVDATWDNATTTNGNLDAFQPSTVGGGHAACVVGYTQDHRFIIRNSWGDSWGDKGFAYASEAYINAGFFNESYGITV
ncbi:C1A family cysteine protease [Paraburkholderia sp. JPY465]|uniref:C1 family peptidase n=1 Tax=Paraburkholderia sp. JPY465 TaxID=3042285 RepID=UPI003D227BBF